MLCKILRMHGMTQPMVKILFALLTFAIMTGVVSAQSHQRRPTAAM